MLAHRGSCPAKFPPQENKILKCFSILKKGPGFHFQLTSTHLKINGFLLQTGAISVAWTLQKLTRKFTLVNFEVAEDWYILASQGPHFIPGEAMIRPPSSSSGHLPSNHFCIQYLEMPAWKNRYFSLLQKLKAFGMCASQSAQYTKKKPLYSLWKNTHNNHCYQGVWVLNFKAIFRW